MRNYSAPGFVYLKKKYLVIMITVDTIHVIVTLYRLLVVINKQLLIQYKNTI